MFCRSKETAWIVKEEGPRCRPEEHFRVSSGADCLVCLVPGHADIDFAQVNSFQQELQAVLPDARFLLSTAAQSAKQSAKLNSTDLDAAALCLANEVNEVLETCLDLKHLSFVGIGTGGLIIRAAISWLAVFGRDSLMTLMSIGTPHLGLWPTCSWTHSLKLWVLKQFMGSPLWLEQLRHGDGRQMRTGRLRRLCETDDALRCFQRVILVGGAHDGLVPISSSLVISPHPEVADFRRFSEPVPEFSRKNLLMFAMPFLWLVRLRAWLVLLVVGLSLLLTILFAPDWPTLRHLTELKATAGGLFHTLSGRAARREAVQLERHLAQRLLKQLPKDHVLRVEIGEDWGGGGWWGRFRTTSSFGAELLCDTRSMRLLAEGYGAYLAGP
ncbi:unnamed protein product [Durusdinium trenchii]|uniref:DUF676 domain-containing protein n=1 Tax=Durusdinium trenchii TaxID=1381693 RepID=A0ABP0ML30_9DINO